MGILGQPSSFGRGFQNQGNSTLHGCDHGGARCSAALLSDMPPTFSHDGTSREGREGPQPSHEQASERNRPSATRKGFAGQRGYKLPQASERAPSERSCDVGTGRSLNTQSRRLTPPWACFQAGDPLERLPLTWASSPPPTGYLFQVRIRRPGSTRYAPWIRSGRARSAIFTPDVGPGTYRPDGRP